MISENNRQFYTKGFTSRTREDIGDNLFRNVLFLTRNELGEIVSSFEKLDNSVSSTDRREKMYKTWLEILKNYTGDKAGEYANLTMEEINQQVFGLPGGGSPFLKGIRHRDITDASVVDDEKFENYADLIRSKYKKLDKLYNIDRYDYSFRSNDKVYYWIEEDLLP